MNRLEILVLNKNAEVYTKYVDIPSTMSFLARLGRHINNFSIVVHVGKKAIYFDKLDPTTLLKELTEFQRQNPQ